MERLIWQYYKIVVAVGARSGIKMSVYDTIYHFDQDALILVPIMPSAIPTSSQFTHLVIALSFSNQFCRF